jgi:hypothetical protein
MAGNHREHGWADDLLARDRVGDTYLSVRTRKPPNALQNVSARGNGAGDQGRFTCD